VECAAIRTTTTTTGSIYESVCRQQAYNKQL
jgi:hypothetical protein